MSTTLEPTELRRHGFSRRPETDADEPFLRALYADTRAHEMGIVPWDSATKDVFLRQQFDAQRLFYRQRYPAAAFDILLRDGYPIGRLYVDRGADAWRLLDITLAPEQRGCGLGAALISDLLTEAATAHLPVLLHVEAASPARRLYRRLGFIPLGDNGVYTFMTWRP
jgi:GNAT superfamily N-acetyltransferase